MTGSNIFSPPINASSQEVWDTTTAIVLKALFKSVFAFFYSLSGLFQLAYFVKCWRTLVRLKPCSDPPRQGNVKKKIIKKGRAWANSGIACVLSVLFTALGEMISLMKSSSPSTVFCIFGCIFHMGVVLDTGIWGLWSKNEPSEISKGDQKRIKWVYLAILFQIYTSVLNT